jgi:hypothetical protein
MTNEDIYGILRGEINSLFPYREIRSNNLLRLRQDIVKIGMDNYIQELLKNDQLKLEMIECANGHAEVVGGLSCVGLDDIGLLLSLDNDEVVNSIVERSGFDAWSDEFLTFYNLIVDDYLREIENFNEKYLKP